MIKEAIGKLVNNEDLSYETVVEVMDEIMSGQASPVLIASYLTALRTKGETIEEISASAMGMRNNAIQLEHDMDVMEIVGTGGDESFTFNISTTSAIVASAAGCKIAKHGNRSVSSKSGAADVLEALGVNINITPEQSKELLDKIGICFLFAQKYHSSMKYVAPVRQELGTRTIFNILGPLTNPANATMQLLGVYDESLVEPLAEVLQKLGVKRGMVVYGQDLMDEITTSAKTTVCEMRENGIKSYELNPADYGFNISNKADLLGGDANVNAQITRDILNGLKGPKRDAVLLNAGACIYLAKDNTTFAEAIEIARQTIDSGKAKEQLEKFIELSNSFDN